MDVKVDEDMATDRDVRLFVVYQRLSELMAMAVAFVGVG